jgi:hypothetical protein
MSPPPVYLLKEALASPLQIHASFNDSSDLVSKLNQDLKHLSKWMGKNKPNSSDYKSKHMPDLVLPRFRHRFSVTKAKDRI